MTHGVTDFSARAHYEASRATLNEAFPTSWAPPPSSSTSRERTGLREADYLIGEDVFTREASARCRIHARETPILLGALPGLGRYRWLHINSGIVNHAYTSRSRAGRTEPRADGAGRGNANREQIEKIFYRAFVFMLPFTATFYNGARRDDPAARDRYGEGSAADAPSRSGDRRRRF